MPTFDPLKYFKTPLTGEAKKKYDDNWDLIFGKKKPKFEVKIYKLSDIAKYWSK